MAGYALAGKWLQLARLRNLYGGLQLGETTVAALGSMSGYTAFPEDERGICIPLFLSDDCFWNRWKRRTQGELADPGPHGRTSVKWK